MEPVRASYASAPGSPVFALHTLGWRAFQDLCAGVLRHVWGQSFQAFADSNDAGRDGAFYGVWHPAPGQSPHEVLSGPFVMQCKHTKRDDTTLSASDMEAEFEKITALVSQDLCRSYILMTNARLTGVSEAEIRRRLIDIGVVHPLVLGGQWLSGIIAAHRELRSFVPRVYGLGDLSQILDERAYGQTAALINSARDQIATFVTTDPYRRAAQSLSDHGFALLLGEPAVGKSVIALMLAIGAADKWNCVTIRATSAADIAAHWNIHEPNQFFWVDDAFGAVRHEEQLTDEWSRHLPTIMTAIKHGARVVVTSRSYIYNDARPLLKDYAFPLLRERQVVVGVDDLSLDERRQILYNHIQFGDQPAEVRHALKPLLEAASAVQPFRPEAARRLGLRSFTKGLEFSDRGSVVDFMARPHQVLRDVYDQIGPDEHAALALVYAAGRHGILREPRHFTREQHSIIDSAGSTPVGALKALRAMTGDFLLRFDQPLSRQGWTFRHPTLWEGFASWLSTQIHMVGVILEGLDDQALLARVDCAETDTEVRGLLLRVPPSLYGEMALRLSRMRSANKCHHMDSGPLYRFLADKCGDAFLKTYLAVDPGILEQLTDFTSYASAVREPDVLARLLRAGALPEDVRRKAIERLTDLAVNTPDSSWLKDPPWMAILKEADMKALLDVVRRELMPVLDEMIHELVHQSVDPPPTETDDPHPSTFYDYADAFGDLGDAEAAQAFRHAAMDYRWAMEDNYEQRRLEEQELLMEEHEDDAPSTYRTSGWDVHREPPSPTRSIFDDIGDTSD